MICDAVGEGGDLRDAAPADRELLLAAGAVLRDVAVLLRGGSLDVDFDQLARYQVGSATELHQLRNDVPGYRGKVRLSFHARTIANAAAAAAADALIATGRADPQTIAVERRRWYGQPEQERPGPRTDSRVCSVPAAWPPATPACARCGCATACAVR